MSPWLRAALFLVLATLIVLTPAALLLVPGILLPWLRRCDEIVGLLVIVVTSSLSFWMAVFWYLPLLGLDSRSSLTVITVLTLAALAALLVLRDLPSLPARPGTAELCLVMLVLCMAALRFQVVTVAEVPAGADMSMHAYIATLIQDAQGVPASYRPLLPIDSFSVFPVGFQFITALLAEFPGFDIPRASLWVSCFAYTLLLLASYALLRTMAPPLPAAIAALAFNLLADDPTGFVTWGGNPTVLATAMFVMLVMLLLDSREQGFRSAVPAGLVLAGLMATHTIVLVQAFYLLLVALPVLCLIDGSWRRVWWPWLVTGLVGCGLVLPYLVAIDPGVVTDATLDWIRHWVRETAHAWQGNLGNALWTIPDYLGDRLDGSLIVITAVVSIPLIFRRRDRSELAIVSFALVSLAVGVLLLINTQHWVLPLSYLIYPERLVLLLILPLSMLLALGLQATGERLPAPRWAAGTGVLLLLVVVGQGVLNNRKDFVEGMAEKASVTANDRQALAWIADNLPKDAVIQNNYGDAGLWIPAIAARAASNAHINVVYLDKLGPQTTPGYRFIGEKCVYQPCKSSAGGELLAQYGNARVYRIGSDASMPLQSQQR